jgi:hypothetical protein
MSSDQPSESDTTTKKSPAIQQLEFNIKLRLLDSVGACTICTIMDRTSPREFAALSARTIALRDVMLWCASRPDVTFEYFTSGRTSNGMLVERFLQWALGMYYPSFKWTVSHGSSELIISAGLNAQPRVGRVLVGGLDFDINEPPSIITTARKYFRIADFRAERAFRIEREYDKLTDVHASEQIIRALLPFVSHIRVLAELITGYLYEMEMIRWKRQQQQRQRQKKKREVEYDEDDEPTSYFYEMQMLEWKRQQMKKRELEEEEEETQEKKKQRTETTVTID